MTYAESLAPAQRIVAERTPRRENESDEAWDRRVRSQYVDSCRFLLPAAALANAGMTANARVLENAVRKFLSHPLAEVREIGKKVKEIAKGEVPTLIKYAEALPYLVETGAEFGRSGRMGSELGKRGPGDWCQLVHYDEDGEDKVLAAALYRFGGMSLCGGKGAAQVAQGSGARATGRVAAGTTQAP